MRAFEKRPGPISMVLKSTKSVYDEQFSFEKLAARRPSLLKASQSRSWQF
jgi:hypothetical protein